MQRHVYRTILIYGIIVVSAIFIYPTVGWMTLDNEERQARLERWREQDTERAKEQAGFFQKTTWAVQRWAEFDRDRVINLGLDLQGGIHMVVGFDIPEEAEREERELEAADVQEMVLQRIRNRVNEFEAKEPIIQKLGANQVQIQLPGEKDIQRAKDLIMQTAFLTFHVVAGPQETSQVFREIHEFSDNNFVPFLEPPLRNGPFQVTEENYEHVASVVAEAEEAGIIPEDKMIAFSAPPKPWEQRDYFIYLLEKEPGSTGEGLKTAKARPDTASPGNWLIIFEFDTDGAREFAELTGANIGNNMAIVLDDKVVSAPVINDRIFNVGTIEGSFTAEEARDLAIALNSGSMPVPIREDYTGVVGPSLGHTSVEKGIQSSIIGLIIVMLFMIVYYRVAGVVANIALAVNALLVVALLAYFDATLTLPGIAGLILTIGMAVDANVLIFERIREELRNGKSLASSIEGGYGRATITILDANITTLIAAAVLTQFGTGPVQGFAVTLSIGVCASVFAALFVTRGLLDFLCGRNMISDLKMFSIIPEGTQLKFIDKRRFAAIGSAVAIAAGLLVFGMRGNDNFGVDFTNGTNMIVKLNTDESIAAIDLRDRLQAAGFETPVVQEYQQDPDAVNEFAVRLGATGGEQEAEVPAEGDEAPADTVSTRVQEALLEFTANPSADDLNSQVELLRVETVGPAVGAQLQRDAVLAITYALLFIVAYLWFRFELKYAVGAVVALTHDVLFTVGIFAIAGRELTIPVIAALLTIIGYSLNDTIVVFDRIREDVKLNRGRGMKFGDLIDFAVSNTLSRTLLTSLTTLFVVLILFLFGGGAINDFAFALIIGIIVGTYSSIFVASPVVFLWQRWRDQRIGHTDEGSETPQRRISKKKQKKKAQKDTNPAAT